MLSAATVSQLREKTSSKSPSRLPQWGARR